MDNSAAQAQGHLGFLIILCHSSILSDLPSQAVLVVKNPPANAGDSRLGFNPESGRSPGEGHGNPFQYSCLGNPMDRRAWWATVHEVAKSQTQLSN